MQSPIQLIVGLGNPGPEHANTRHNAGAWLVERLAEDANVQLNLESKFHGVCGRIDIAGQDCRLLIPTTYMNLSGQSIIAMAKYFKIVPESILVAHDELDLPPGTAKFKEDGGDGGHNGLRNTTSHLKTKKFWRCRIGIGHPGHRDKVLNYILATPNKKDRELIELSLSDILLALPNFVNGDTQAAMRLLHQQAE